MRTRAVIATTLAAVVVFGASTGAGVIADGTPLALLRLPLDGALATVVVTALPWRRVRAVVAAIAGLLLLLTLLSAALDRGFREEVGARFNVITGWPELADGFGVLRDSAGSAAAIGVLAALLAASAAAVVAVTLSLLRLGRVLRLVRQGAVLIGTSSLAAVWAIVALVGAQVVPGLPVAAADSVDTVVSRSDQAAATERSQAEFQASGASDSYADTPTSQLLTGLRGKDVIVAFIESYGQVAVQGTSFSKGVDSVLKAGEKQLAADGYSDQSAWLDSPTYGGVSWLAHSTLQTGQWIDSQQRYDEVTSGSRFTLSDAFGRAGWRTVSDVPSDAAPWPVGSSFYHYDTQLNSQNVGYAGPRFSYARIPDQYTWNWFDQHELRPAHKPLFAEIDFDSSHTPWTPLPHLVPWNELGDGSIYDVQPGEGLPPSVVWQSPQHVQQLYGQSVQYTLSSLFQFVHRSTDPNLALVVLGDHQPNAEVSGHSSNHVVPISIISKDPSVFHAISAWHWQPGMLPSPDAPLWRMSAFRNRFLDAFDG
ncbi:hypothetical protein [Frondihabitans australicus]|uniref:Phosphoglycerol transferase MdoB-like AlkP superfamily enzyme n=1 Tax=Frondihabitans australicus TaxID=386892 RepID=A0A495IH05_9MICO|nr:hypothetical protein [Frondihabitans australicus]RKR75244.1 hypothetical protein C8E83_2382 [Frondihabitans australicus]